MSRAQKSLSFALIAVAFLLVLAALLFVLAGLNKIPVPALSTTTVSPTTLWPYGQPEYNIEVPEGYEDLLPGTGPINPTEPVPEKSMKSKLGKSPTPDRTATKAEPYVLRVKKAYGNGKPKPTLIVVIDDVGYNIQQLEPFLNLPFPLTIAILPRVDHSTEAAALTSEAGKEVILHQPMQALGGNDPGPGAIHLRMSPDEAAATLAENLADLPQAVGVNNHMGSAVTRDAGLMRSVLYLVKNRGIYYLDSLTAPDTATSALCSELSIPYWERDVFLDNTGDKQSILRALEEGKKIASSRGASVLIGHVWSSELAQTLMEIYPQLVEEGYSLSTISKYMIQSALGDYDARSGN